MRVPFAPVLLLLAAVPAAHAARPVTVAQLEQILASDHGKSDRHVADQVSKLTLTERLCSERLARWENALPGRRTEAALLLLADESALLNLPAADVVSDPVPPKGGGVIFDHAIEYTNRTLHNLPNFLATRTTTHFEDSLREAMGQSGKGPEGSGADSAGAPMESVNTLSLHLAAKYSAPVAYRDGKEKRAAFTPQGLGLTTTGEFGPILAVVMSDAVHNRLTWGYWQRTAAGPVAVFRYKVPASGSHYEVDFPGNGEVRESYPSYHGEIAVNPATGSIRRLTIISEIDPPAQIVGSGIAVEYGAVVIGQRTYNCPLHGVAISRTPITVNHSARPVATETRLNDIAFTGYHLFRADARILSPEELRHLEQEPPPH